MAGESKNRYDLGRLISERRGLLVDPQKNGSALATNWSRIQVAVKSPGSKADLANLPHWERKALEASVAGGNPQDFDQTIGKAAVKQAAANDLANLWNNSSGAGSSGALGQDFGLGNGPRWNEATDEPESGERQEQRSIDSDEPYEDEDESDEASEDAENEGSEDSEVPNERTEADRDGNKPKHEDGDGEGGESEGKGAEPKPETPKNAPGLGGSGPEAASGAAEAGTGAAEAAAAGTEIAAGAGEAAAIATAGAEGTAVAVATSEVWLPILAVIGIVVILVFGFTALEMLYPSTAGGDTITETSSPIEGGIPEKAAQIAYEEYKKGITDNGNNTGSELTKYFKAGGCAAGNPWCAAFISYVFQEAGGDGPHTCLSTTALAFFNKSPHKKLNIHSNIPQVGDLLWKHRVGGAGHVGIVYKVEGTNVITIEGNSGPNSDRVAKITNSNYGRDRWEYIGRW